MEDLKKQINFDSGLLYYSTPNERNDEISKGSGLNVVQETYNSSNRKHICVICGKRFFTQNSLKTHLEHHPADIPVKANLEKDDSSDWKSRFVINKGSCVKTNCNFIALDSVDYSRHTASCEGIRFTKENSSSYCELCDCYFSSKNYFQAHCVLQHPEKGPNISLKDDDQMNTKISDPVSLYVNEKNFENERSSLLSAVPSMYPDSVVTKKKLKSVDLETSTINMSEGPSSETNGNDLNFSIEPSVSEAVEILKTAIAADSQISNERSSEIYSENETELSISETVVDENLINFEVSTAIQDRPTDIVHEEQQPLEMNSEEISTELRDAYNIPEVQIPVDISSEEISSEIQNDKDVQITIFTSHNPIETPGENKYNLPAIEPMETESSVITEHPNDEMNDHVGLQVLSEICETLSSKNLLMMENRPESIENQDISCDNQSKRRNEDGMELSAEQTEATVQGNDVNNVCSRGESAVKNPTVNDKALLNYTQQASSSEYHVLLAAAASLGDELLSMTETSSNENSSTEQSKSVKNISRLKSALSSKRDFKKTEKNQAKSTEAMDNESESNDLDLKQQEKLAVLASSNLVPKKTNLKSYQKVGKYLKTMTPKENRTNSRSPFASRKSNLKRKYESESFDSDNLNVKQRSVRQRKKLILPDFEYSLENKAEFSDSSTNENSSFSMGDGEPAKKRGRPRKRRDDESGSKTSDIGKKAPPVSNKKNISASKKYSKHADESEEQSEEFSLNTTINEAECDSRFDDSYAADVSHNDSKIEHIIEEEDDDTNDGIHSWLKKVDFSEQTSFTWCENTPKKKLGRPRKKRRNVDVWKNLPKTSTKVETVPKISTVCNGESNQVIIKKKKGRPLLKEKPTVIQQQVKTEPAVTKSTPVEKNKTSPADGSPRKRGRPCKVKVEDKTSADPVQSREVAHGAKNQVAKIAEPVVPKNQDKVKTKAPTKLNISAAPKTQNVKPKGASSQIVLVKKRGRPRKSVVSGGENNDSSKTSSADTKSDEPSEAVIVNNADNQSALLETSNCLPDHSTASVTEADLVKTGQNDLRKTADPPKTVAPPKTDDLPKIAGLSKTVDSLKTADDVPRTVNLPKTADALKTAELPKIADKLKTADPLKAANSPKTDQSDSNSVDVPRKKRGRPLKKKRLLLDQIEPELNAFDKSKQLSDATMDTTNKNEDSTSEMDVFSDVRQEELTDESYQEPRHHKPTLWKKKKVTQRVKVAPEKPIPDETQQIDEALYHADLRNKSKYSKVFKKVLITTEDSQNPDELVVCGRCQKKMTKRHYFRYHRVSHYYLCWLENEPEIDLNDDFEVNRILQSMVNPDALRKKAIRLACEQCDKVMKSVVGYVSHVRFCQKDEGELLEKCRLCARALKPSSIRHHYIKFHGVTKFAPTNDSKLIPIAYAESKRSTISNPSLNREELTTVTVKNTFLGYERTEVDKIDILSDEHFWKSLKTSYDLYMCMGLNCRHMTLGKDDLKSHILSCAASFCEFSCLSCSFMTKYESEIIYHRKKKCKVSSDSEDNAEDKAAADQDRRISRRVKKKKFFYGCDDDTPDANADAGPGVDVDVKTDVDVEVDDEVDVDYDVDAEELKREAEDDDFVVDEEDSVDSVFSDDEYMENHVQHKDRSKKQKADILLNKTFEESGVRNAFLYHKSTRLFDSLNSTVELRLETFATSPSLANLRVDINEWETFPISDFLKYLPIQHKSPKVSFDGSPYVQLKVFDSDLIKGVPVCNTGGPVWSMAWAPLPAQVTEQYLAVAGLQHMNHVVNVEKSVEFASIVQIWKYGSLDNISNDIHAPTLAWAIAHNYGAVWGMEWCPSGGFDNSSTPCRLGILALATSSGCCVVYSMPRLDCGGETRSIAANPEPDLVLKVRIDDVQCTRIVWKRNTVPDTIYGGFSDGTIALWNVIASSSILKKGKTLYPYRTFQAHLCGITALDVHWLDNCRFMVTSSADRQLRFWDLEDLSGPMYEHEQTNINVSGAWMHHWTCAAIASDYLNQIEPTSYVCSPRELSERKRPILNIKDTFWRVAYSDWNDAVATSSNGGCVVVYAAKHLATLTYKMPAFEKIITQTLVEPLPEEEKIQSESVEADMGLPPTNDSFDCSSLVRDYGIKFCDRLKNKPSSETVNFGIDKGNITSVNQVCWNQNYNSFNWLALGYDCGFVRVIRVERFDKSHLTKFYKLNENSTITLV